MPRKRHASDRSDEDTDESFRESKRQKVLPHRGKFRTVVDQLLDSLGPATSDSLANFNNWEKTAKRRGVTPIDIYVLEIELKKLQDAENIEILDDKIDKIDSKLKVFEDLYNTYMANAEGRSKEDQLAIEAALMDVISRIQMARNNLPEIKVILLSKPPPTEYANTKNCEVLQNTLPNPMLCMRPVKCRGLPIFLLHRVFAQYLLFSKKSLPTTDKARIALQVSKELCNIMANSFDNEKARTDAFVRTIKPLFHQWMTTKEFTSQGTTASTRTDVTISAKEIIMVLTEIKNGKNGGDPYTQASRGYEINTEQLSEKNPSFLACGAPTFICCLNDEELRIAGAFKDGKQVVVEPLSYDLLYPDSRPDGRTMQLAQNLFALYSCLEILAKEIESPVLSLTNEPNCPRVFPKIRNTGTHQDEQLEFKKLRKDHWETADGTIDYLNLIFDATLGGTKVLAKVVLRPYGKDVHAHLAAKGMAPRLYGTSELPGIASVIVMELLEDGWMTLWDYRKNWHRQGIQEEPKGRLLNRLEEILKYLEDAKMVHGDFRMANIMLKEGEEGNAMLIDFDWAGREGEVNYALTRSDGRGYPGEAGGPIERGHDRQFYETWRDDI